MWSTALVGSLWINAELQTEQPFLLQPVNNKISVQHIIERVEAFICAVDILMVFTKTNIEECENTCYWCVTPCIFVDNKCAVWRSNLESNPKIDYNFIYFIWWQQYTSPKTQIFFLHKDTTLQAAHNSTAFSNLYEYIGNCATQKCQYMNYLNVFTNLAQDKRVSCSRSGTVLSYIAVSVAT